MTVKFQVTESNKCSEMRKQSKEAKKQYNLFTKLKNNATINVLKKMLKCRMLVRNVV